VREAKVRAYCKEPGVLEEQIGTLDFQESACLKAADAICGFLFWPIRLAQTAIAFFSCFAMELINALILCADQLACPKTWIYSYEP
jgi:hypothetical protein